MDRVNVGVMPDIDPDSPTFAIQEANRREPLSETLFIIPGLDLRDVFHAQKLEFHGNAETFPPKDSSVMQGMWENLWISCSIAFFRTSTPVHQMSW